MMKNKRLRAVVFGVVFAAFCGTTFAEALQAKKPMKSASMKTITVAGKPINLKGVYVDRLQKIKKEGVTVVYPTFVPARFSVEDISVTNDEDNKPNYQLSYIDRKKKLSFTIETAYSGIGDGPDGDKTLKGNSKVFGPFTIDIFKPWSEGNNTKDIYFLSSWMEDEKRKKSAKKDPATPRDGRYYHFLGNGVTEKEAVAIVESLSPIK